MSVVWASVLVKKENKSAGNKTKVDKWDDIITRKASAQQRDNGQGEQATSSWQGVNTGTCKDSKTITNNDQSTEMGSRAGNITLWYSACLSSTGPGFNPYHCQMIDR